MLVYAAARLRDSNEENLICACTLLERLAVNLNGFVSPKDCLSLVPQILGATEADEIPDAPLMFDGSPQFLHHYLEVDFLK